MHPPHRLALLTPLITLACTVALALLGCSPKHHEMVVAEVGDQPITLKEYEDMYIKTIGS